MLSVLKGPVKGRIRPLAQDPWGNLIGWYLGTFNTDAIEHLLKLKRAWVSEGADSNPHDTTAL